MLAAKTGREGRQICLVGSIAEGRAQDLLQRATISSVRFFVPPDMKDWCARQHAPGTPHPKALMLSYYEILAELCTTAGVGAVEVIDYDRLGVAERVRRTLPDAEIVDASDDWLCARLRPAAPGWRVIVDPPMVGYFDVTIFNSVASAVEAGIVGKPLEFPSAIGDHKKGVLLHSQIFGGGPPAV